MIESESPHPSKILSWIDIRQRPNRTRIVGVVLALLFLAALLFELGSSSGVKTALQVDFENYVLQYEQRGVGGESPAQVLPRIHVTIHSTGDAQRELLIDPSEGQNVADKAARILSLSREAGVFGLNRGAEIDGDGVVLRIEDGSKEFVTSFSREDIQNNVKAESLLKLLTIHGRPLT